MAEQTILKKLILQKLARANVWGAKHTPLDFIIKGIPEHYPNTHKGKRAIEKAIKELLNDAWVLLPTKKTGKGSDAHISLNPRKVNEIKQFLENFD